MCGCGAAPLHSTYSVKNMNGGPDFDFFSRSILLSPEIRYLSFPYAVRNAVFNQASGSLSETSLSV